jgi:transposase
MRSNGKRARRERRSFSPEFKREAVRLTAERRAHGAKWSEVGRELDVRPDQLAQGEFTSTGGLPGETLEQEVRRLRREVAVLKQEQAFAKKVAVYFARESH